MVCGVHRGTEGLGDNEKREGKTSPGALGSYGRKGLPMSMCPSSFNASVNAKHVHS